MIQNLCAAPLTAISLTTATKYTPPQRRRGIMPGTPSGQVATDQPQTALPQAAQHRTADTQPITLHNIAWARLSNVKKSIDGTTGVFFLYFDQRLQPALCLKLASNPYSEHYCATLFRSLGLFTPNSQLLDRKSENYQLLCDTLENDSLALERQGLLERSDKMYALLQKIKAFDASIDHLLLMECVHGRSLDEARKQDWTHDTLKNDQFYVELGKGLVADAFVLNSDRYYFLYAHNPGNFRLPYPKHATHTSPLCFIDQAVDALRLKAPRLRQDTLVHKFDQLLTMTYPPVRQRLCDAGATQQSLRGAVHAVGPSTVMPGQREKTPLCVPAWQKMLDINTVDDTISLHELITTLAKDVEAETRHPINDRQKALIQKGIAEAFTTLGSTLMPETVLTLYNALPDHPLKASIPVNLLLSNLEKAHAVYRRQVLTLASLQTIDPNNRTKIVLP